MTRPVADYMWQPSTEGDRRAQALGRHLDCCGNDAYRGRLCTYHQGWADGWDERDGAANDR